MNTKKIKLFLDMLDKYMETHAYDYVIRCMTPYENGIIFSIGELTPGLKEMSSYILILEYKDKRISFKNEQLLDCIYDYLEEDGRTIEEANQYMEQFYQMLKDEVDYNVYWYELCFFGDEDCNSKSYNAEKACSYVIKTEIPPVIDDKIALQILFADMTEEWAEEIKNNLTCVMEITEDEASSCFDVEGLMERITDELGTYYKRK